MNSAYILSILVHGSNFPVLPEPNTQHRNRDIKIEGNQKRKELCASVLCLLLPNPMELALVPGFHSIAVPGLLELYFTA